MGPAWSGGAAQFPSSTPAAGKTAPRASSGRASRLVLARPHAPAALSTLAPQHPALGTLAAAGGRKQRPSPEGEKTPEESSNLAPLIT